MTKLVRAAGKLVRRVRCRAGARARRLMSRASAACLLKSGGSPAVINKPLASSRVVNAL